MASGRSQFGTLTRRSFYSKGGPVRIKKIKDVVKSCLIEERQQGIVNDIK